MTQDAKVQSELIAARRAKVEAEEKIKALEAKLA